MQLFGLLATAAVAVAHRSAPRNRLDNFKNFITFGDSYTDEGRLAYMYYHNGTNPPIGQMLPASNATDSGGYTWARFVANSTGATLYNYAVIGAGCSNSITPRYFDETTGDFPDIQGYEIPTFKADLAWINETTGTNTLYTNRKAGNTVYAMWIGTNDLGDYAFIDDSQVAGTVITDFTDCTFEVWDEIYDTGGRYFVLLNMAPLELSPQYGLPGMGGQASTNYWPTKGSNITEISYKMKEYSLLVNRIWDVQAPFELLIANRWPGAEFVVYNVHALISDIYDDPASYLQAPYNTTGFYHHCDTAGNCFDMPGDPHSFLWYDALHPSERVDEVIATEFLNVLRGNSTYATYWHDNDGGRGNNVRTAL